MGYASAMLLSRMVPEKAAELRARAEEYAHNRVVCGDHYSSDLKGSKEASEIVLGNMAGKPGSKRNSPRRRRSCGDRANGYNEGVAPVETSGKWGFIDKQGGFAIQPVYQVAHSFAEGLADVEVDGKWGFAWTTRGASRFRPGLRRRPH